MIRTFLALDFQQSTKNQVIDFIGSLKQIDSKVKWVSEKNLHLTIKFWGDLPEEQVRKLQNELTAPCFSQPVHYKIAQKGAFPNLRKPRVLWLGIEDINQSLNQLFQDIEKVSKKLSLPLETKKFKPHLTIGRIKYPQDLQLLIDQFQKQPFSAVEEKAPALTLYKSELTRKGPIYQALYQNLTGR